MKWFLAGTALAAAAGLGCARDLEPPHGPSEEPVGLFVLETAIGPIDVLGFHDSPDGDLTVRLHRVTALGEHESPEIRMEVNEDPQDPEATSLSYVVLHSGVETCRYTRRIRAGVETDVALDLRAGGEALTLRAGHAEGGIGLQATVIRDWEGSASFDRLVEVARVGDPEYVNALRDALLQFYPGGPLADPPDLRLLYAVLSASDWENHTATGSTSPVDQEMERRMRRLCTVAAAVGKIACLIARFDPWAWLICVPAEGISAACLAYNIQQAFADDDHDENQSACRCTCGCAP